MQTIINKKESSKIKRLNLIVSKLRAKPYTIKELSELLGVSTKTIQRDLYENLSDYGAVKNGHYWSIDDNIASDGLNVDERIVINILDSVSKNMGANFYSKAHVLLEQISQKLNHPILTNISNEKLSQDDLVSFEILENAIKDRREISCVYNDYEFCVKPLKLALFDGFWYLILLDKNKDDMFKKFHLKSIKQIKISDQFFSITDELKERIKGINSAWANLEKPQTARLLLSPQVAKYFERKPQARQQITGKDTDGSVEIELSFTHIMEIKPLIYYYLPFIKVLSPKWLDDELKNELKEYILTTN